jgi:hypothetical protein
MVPDVSDDGYHGFVCDLPHTRPRRAEPVRRVRLTYDPSRTELPMVADVFTLERSALC